MEETVASQFYNKWKPILAPIASAYGINPDYLITQLGQESMWGTITPRGSHNYAGIHEFRKGHDGVVARDAGNLRKFRKYDNDEAFADDYVRLMARLYPGTTKATNITEFATSLQNGKGGRKWAESPNYIDDLSTVYNDAIANVIGRPSIEKPQSNVVESKWGLSNVATPNAQIEGYSIPSTANGQKVENPFLKLYSTTTKPATQQSTPYRYESDDKWLFHTKPYKIWGL